MIRLNRSIRLVRLVSAVFVLFLLCAPSRAFAQADEIQVYDGGLAPKGIFNLTLHTNFIAKGIMDPAFPGAVVADKSLNGVPEWAFGVTRWFEAGLYLPLYSRNNYGLDGNRAWGVDGVKLRTLIAVPDADSRTFFYGANFEFSYNTRRWDTTRITSEIRPIVGWHVNKVDLIFNPIVDTSYDGFGNMTFVPAFRVAYNTSENWAVAAEEYSDFGPFHEFHARADQSHQLYGVINYKGALEVEAGVGVGLTDASDRLTFKLILARDLNKIRQKK